MNTEMLPIPIFTGIKVVENPTLWDALPYMMGFLVVLMTLATLWLICVAIGKVLERSAPEPTVVKSRAASPSASDEVDAVSLETLVVIAAAVEAAAGSGRRIVSVKQQNTSWYAAGRDQIQNSHKIR